MAPLKKHGCPENIKRVRRNAVRMRRDQREPPPPQIVAAMQAAFLVRMAREGALLPRCPSAPKKKTHAVKRCGRMKPKKLF